MSSSDVAKSYIHIQLHAHLCLPVPVCFYYEYQFHYLVHGVGLDYVMHLKLSFKE